ncbi:hypothetical protein [Streptomyces violens]|uniref:hypothetical protein n=1 Tax=Streptomyces violens TaxID=66377 RepID=UPI0007C8079A|nr:hypothetical protein [Streptomyces violens]
MDGERERPALEQGAGKSPEEEIKEPEELSDDTDDPEDSEDISEVFDRLWDLPQSEGAPNQFIYYVPGGNVNNGAMFGDQHVENRSGPAGGGGRRVEVHEGPISAEEILEAQAGFAEPVCFPEALRKLGTGLLFLAGQPGTGRRTTALNLLRRQSDSMALRAVDSDDLASWRPTRNGARGYLVDGLFPEYLKKAGAVGNLRARLSDAGACMVIVLPDDPGLLRSLERDLHISPVRCTPPPPRAVFDARLEAAVPHPGERERLLVGLDAGLLDELLAPEMVPGQVAELVTALVNTVDGQTADGQTADGQTVDGATRADDIRSRLSFLAEGEVPELLQQLLDDADGLAFLLAACVFEGVDHRVVREEAERLLELADGRLSSVLPPTEDEGGRGGGQPAPRPNPRFVFRRSLDGLLRTVRAECAPQEIRSTSGYIYAVEPVRFTRHRQAEAVLKYVWRQYGQLSGLLTDWMGGVRADRDLTQPVGRVMGMAARWGGGRRALWHIRDLAKSDRMTSRAIAAYALGMAADDPVLAGEVKHFLRMWSHGQNWQLRSTVAHACGTDFGASRPDQAMKLLRYVPRRHQDDKDERLVDRAVRTAVRQLFASGSQATVFQHLADWAGGEGADAELAYRTFADLLSDARWFHEQLLTDGEFADVIIAMVRRNLNDDDLFWSTSRSVLSWCREAAWSETAEGALEILLEALAQDMQHGVLRLFVVLEQQDDADLPGRHIARQALGAWRRGEPAPAQNSAQPHGRTP